MDAVKFLLEYDRMCSTCIEHDCDGCYLNGEINCSISVLLDCKDKGQVSKFVDCVELWSKDHPKKTILNDLLEKYPNIRLDKKKHLPTFCPSLLGYEDAFSNDNKNNLCDGSDCEKCWNAELE